MNDFNVIDNFMQTFINYIDGGFGLLNGDVAGLASILIALDVTIAALFWALDGEANILARLIKKVLYVGAFAFLINNFSNLSTIVYNSFATLGLTASNNTLTAADLLKPGKLAGIGYQAAHPLLQEAGKLMGFTSFFSHVVTILVLVGAWFLVVLAFFILAVQLFITILEFKLTTLAGFVLVPFALWSKTAFLAERVLGNVVSSGIKVMVLAVIIGIGSSFFGQFTSALQGDPSLTDAMTLVLAALSLFGLGIFGPAIASGLVSGGPQLGAGAAVGTAGALMAGGALAGAGAVGGLRALTSGGLSAIRAGASMTGAASTAYQMGQATSGSSSVGAGLGGVARAAAAATGNAGGAAASNFASNLQGRAAAGAQAAFTTTGGRRTGGPPNSSSTPSGGPSPGGSAGGGGSSATPPAWARRLQGEQRRRGHAQTVSQAIKEGDRPAHGATPDLEQE